MSVANPVRGEVIAHLGGRARRLCLTFQALAEIEAALGVSGLGEIGARLPILSDPDLARVLEALLRGGGETPADVEEALVAGARRAFAEAVAETLMEALR